jgi:hypothetical protein
MIKTIIHPVKTSRSARIGLGLEFPEFPGTYWSTEELKANHRRGFKLVPCAIWDGDHYVYYAVLAR